MVEPRIKKKITSEEFNAAYYGIPGNEESCRTASDNRGVLKAALRPYSKHIPPDDLERCGYIAVWKCLEYFDASFGQKFTTSLHRHTVWECRRELKRFARYRRSRPIENEESLPSPQPPPLPDLCGEDVKRAIELLPCSWQKQIIQQKFFEGMTLKEIAAAKGFCLEVAKNRLNDAMEELRSILREMRAGVVVG